jgi:hypothetical protein
MSSMKMRSWVCKAALVVALAGCAMEHAEPASSPDTLAEYQGTAYVRPGGHPACPDGHACEWADEWAVADGVVYWRGCELDGGPSECEGFAITSVHAWDNGVVYIGLGAAPDHTERFLVLVPAAQ